MNNAREGWAELQAQAADFFKHFELLKAFNGDNQRAQRFTLKAPHLVADLSKQLWDEPLRQRLLAFAEASGVAARRDCMWRGETVNTTEQRAVEHVHLRMPPGNGYRHLTDSMLDMAELVRHDPRWTDVVHLGVGGSALGPELVLQALEGQEESRIKVHVVGNMDGHELHHLLLRLRPASTLFVVASKSWSTLETRLNATEARHWLEADGALSWADHAVAVTAYPAKAEAEGYRMVLRLPESVGGRFSVWSSVGMPVAVQYGRKAFEDLLAGAHEMDEHFRLAPALQNVPINLGLLDVWNASFLRMDSRCVVPYCHGLRRLPAYLQQLEMESNGKQVAYTGKPLAYATAPAVWGEVGSNGQHAFFQWLHQSPQRTPVELVLVAKAAHGLSDHHRWLNANALAQAQALMQGQVAGSNQLSGHQDFPGNRPSTVLLLDDLTPKSLGALLALYEHKTFVAGVLWGVNSFDQWGVELGKQLAKSIEPALKTGNTQGLDPSTANLVHALRAYCA